MTSRQALETVAGLTQASRVTAFVTCSEAELGTLTRALVPLNESAPPYLPAAVQAALASEPALPFPELSATVVPAPASKEYAATSPEAAVFVVLLVVVEKGPRLPAASVARTS